ncbi:MAG: universal stress protein [Candidatus Sericytochromatia bacterium]
MKYKHILLCADSSETTKRVVSHAKEIAKVFGAEITVLSVYQANVAIPTNLSLPKEIYEKIRKENDLGAKKVVDEIVHELTITGVNAGGLVQEGIAKKIICDSAKKLSCDLIIMGTRKHSEMTNYLGSTSSYVINNTPNIPVLVVD